MAERKAVTGCNEASEQLTMAGAGEWLSHSVSVEAFVRWNLRSGVGGCANAASGAFVHGSGVRSPRGKVGVQEERRAPARAIVPRTTAPLAQGNRLLATWLQHGLPGSPTLRRYHGGEQAQPVNRKLAR